MPAQLPLFNLAPTQTTQSRLNRAADKPAIYTLAAAINAFLHAKKTAGASEHTLKAYHSDFNHLLAAVGHDTPLTAITDNTLTRFLADRAKHCKPKTLERATTSTRSLFAWLTDTRALPRNPATNVKYKPLPVTLPKLPTSREMQQILDTAAGLSDPRPNALVNLILHTGIKKGELMRLELGDISRAAVLVKYTNPKLLWKARRLPLPDHILPILWQYREACPETDQANLWFPFAEKTVELAIARAGYTAGLPFSLTAETLRWSYAIRQSKAGTPPDTLREHLGLSTIAWPNARQKIRALGRLYG